MQLTVFLTHCLNLCRGGVKISREW